jgi:hypothetical protein
MLYQLPSGKVIELSVEQYLSLSDEELGEIVRLDLGNTLENPFHGSALDGKYMAYDDMADDPDVESELPDINLDDKLSDEDFIRDDI